MTIKLDDNIEKCTLTQVQTLQTLAIDTYHETFSDSNSEALLQEYYRSSLNINLLSQQLQNPLSEFYFIYSAPKSEASAEIAGFLKLNIGEAQTDLLTPDSLEVEKIYILKKHLYKGLGKQLIALANERAKQQNKKYLWLGVWEHNYAAQKFYQKMGFEQFSQHAFNMGGDIQTDILLKKTVE